MLEGSMASDGRLWSQGKPHTLEGDLGPEGSVCVCVFCLCNGDRSLQAMSTFSC